MTGPVDEKIANVNDWRGALLTRIRMLIREADPAISEDVKWRKPSNPLGVPTWSREGILCTGETYKDKVKLTFMRGGALSDPEALFNASLDGVRRAIDFREGETVNVPALAALIREAVAANISAKQS